MHTAYFLSAVWWQPAEAQTRPQTCTSSSSSIQTGSASNTWIWQTQEASRYHFSFDMEISRHGSAVTALLLPCETCILRHCSMQVPLCTAFSHQHGTAWLAGQLCSQCPGAALEKLSSRAGATLRMHFLHLHGNARLPLHISGLACNALHALFVLQKPNYFLSSCVQQAAAVVGHRHEALNLLINSAGRSGGGVWGFSAPSSSIMCSRAVQCGGVPPTMQLC